MNAEQEKLRKKQVLDDVSEVLSTEAGRRVFGSIFHAGRMSAGTLDVNSPTMTAFQEGMRAMANMLANTIRQIDPHLVADCEVSYDTFCGQFDAGGGDDDGE